MKRLHLLSCALAMSAAFSCQRLQPIHFNDVLVFDNMGTSEQDYRIPAIISNKDGELVVFADRRYSELGADIGSGRIDIENRISSDGGRTWGEVRTIISGNGEEGFDYAHGDAAVVCDRESGRILLMCASGSKSYPDGGCQIGRYYSEDGGRSFSGGEMEEPAELSGMNHFFTSGRICQSRKIKTGSYFRIYSGVVTPSGSLIFYSDDFGQSWASLGKPVAEGNESKVEELPDGSLLHSCRISGQPGRIYCTYKYTDATYSSVKQSSPRKSSGIMAASCNGELLMSEISDKEWLMLQSVAKSNIRENVSIYWKRINASDSFLSPSFYDKWDGYLQVSDTTSCYSSMTLCKDGSIGFIWEAENTPREHVESYDIFFCKIRMN